MPKKSTKLSKKSDPSVTFLNGYSPRKGAVGILAFPDALHGDVTFTRFFTKTPEDQWFHLDFDFDCKSVTATYSPSEKIWYVLGKNGEVAEVVVGGKTTVTQIPGTGLTHKPDIYGYLDTIKNIGGEIYVCGYRRQLYKRKQGKWIRIAPELLTHENGVGFMDMDGTSDSNIYAVGWKGEIYFYNGKSWLKSNSPTTEHLTSVRCVSKKEIWICGNNGTVIHGNHDRWHALEDSNYKNHWYCIEEFNGKIYLAGNNLLACIEDQSIKEINPGLNKSVTTHRLHSKDGLLWSIGEKEILVFDGKSWKEIIHPDNK